MSIPDSPAFQLTNAMTLEGWVFIRQYGGFICFRGDNRGGLDTWVLDTYQSGFVNFQLDDENNNYQSVRAPIALNEWHHVAATWDRTSGDMKIYMDGALVTLTNTTVIPIGQLDAGSEPAIGIGNHGGTFHQFPLNGLVDEFAIYNRALTATEIQSIHAAGILGKCVPEPPSTNCTPSPTGLVGSWKGEGDANDAVGSSSGTLRGNVTFATGKVGQGFRLNGTDSYVEIPDSPTLKPATVTVEAWVWLDPLATNPSLEFIIFKKNSWDFLFEGYSLLKQSLPVGDGVFVDRFSFVISRDGNQVIIYSTTAVQRGVWYHVAGTYDGNQSKLWVNGVEEGFANAGFPLDYGNRSVFIGTSGQPDPYNGKLTGIIDEPSIYNRALTSNEISAIYNAGSAGKCSVTNFPPTTPPVISSVTPNSGTVGSTITVSGSNFSSVPENNIVYFGAVRAVVTSASLTSLTVTVPVGATHAPITVTVGGLTATSRLAFTPTFPGGEDISTARFSPRFSIGTGNGPVETVIADLDGDGNPDIAVTDNYAHTISLYRNVSVAGTLDAGSFEARVVIPASAADYSPYMLVAGDVDGDGKLDLVASDMLGNTVSVFRNQAVAGSLSASSFAPFVSFAVGDGPRAVALVDLDADGRPEIVVANNGSSTVSVLRNTSVNGQILFAPRFDLTAGTGANGLVVADLDGDGKADIATANASGASLSLIRNVGGSVVTSNSFAPAVTIAGPDNAHFMRAADLDGDGRPDLLVTSYLGQTLTVCRNQSSAGLLDENSFAAGVTFGLAGRGHTISLGDLNGDGKPDIAVDTEIGDSVALFQNQSSPGSFASDSLAARVDLGAGWNAWGSSVGDLDGDGRPDIVYCNAYEATISIYRNTSGETPSPCVPPSSGLVGWWRGEGNGLDATNLNTGSPASGLSFAPGKVGQAFSFDGADDHFDIPASPSLDVGAGDGLTFETWVKPSSINMQVVAEWNNGAGGVGSHLWLSVDHTVAGDGVGNIYVNLYDTTETSHGILAPAGVMIANAWQHIAVTYDKPSGVAKIYRNGVEVSSQNLGTFTPQTSYDLHLGYRASSAFAGTYFGGLMDEPSLYNRALTAAEIQNIFDAGSGGKCAPPPSLIIAGPITNAANGHAYYLLSPTNWPAAEAIAVSLGGHLATINNAAESLWVYNTFGAYGGGDYTMWIGRTDEASEGNWRWTSGWGGMYSNWSPGQPDNYGGAEHHAWIWSPAHGQPPGSWNDAPGHFIEPAVVEVGEDAPLPVILAGPITNAANGHAYYLLSPTNWPAAEAIAVSLGGHLATINDADENTWVFNTFSAYDGGDYNLWIGYTDQVSEGQWRWINGWRGTYAPWYWGEPNNSEGIEHYAWIWSPNSGAGGSWNDAASNTLVAAVVELGMDPPLCTAPPNGLFGLWRAEGNANDSYAQNNGAMVNGASFATGIVSQAFTFDGVNDYVAIPQKPELNPGNQVTIEFWMKADPTNAMNSYQGLVVSDFFGIEIANGYALGPLGVNFFISTDGGATVSPSSYPDTATVNGGGAVVSAGAWHHVAGTYDGTKLQLYIDGQSWGNPAYHSGPISPMLANSFVSIGSEDGRTICPDCIGSRYFNGMIDDVGIYKRALSADEIHDIYIAADGGKCSPPPIDSLIIAGPITNSANGHWYYLTTELPWHDAENLGQRLGGHLTTINDDDENNWVFNTFSSWGETDRELWIGLTDEANEGEWIWSNDSASTYRHWLDGQPDNWGGWEGQPGEDFAHFWMPNVGAPPGTWNDAPGYLSHFGVIEVSLTNDPPQTLFAAPDTLTTSVDVVASFNARKLLLNDHDSMGYLFVVSNVSSNSALGGTVSLVSGRVHYTPPSGFEGNDQFTYSITNDHGNTATSTVTATVGRGGPVGLNITYGPVVDGGEFVVRFAGIPGLTYTIEASPYLEGGWTKVGNFIAPTTDTGFGIGVFEFREPITGDEARYYRTVYPSY